MDLRLHFLVPADPAWLPRVEAAISGGVSVVQLRAKGTHDRTLLAVGQKLRELTDHQGVSLVVNDRPDLALLLEADGVHLGQSDLPAREVRRLVGSSLLIGLSTHSLSEAIEACEQPVDYLAFGPVFSTRSKQAVAPTTGLRTLAEVTKRATKPVVAIGGISSANSARIREAGAVGLAVIEALALARDPAKEAQALLA
ncbi:MAG: thiamine phosphate synthase [Sulfobacillus sp.]